MREILFKAKRVDNGEWVNGFYLRREDEHIIEEKSPHPEYRVVFTEHSVLQETVCQFTGLLDKNGVKIFEGDILIDKRIYEVIWTIERARFSLLDRRANGATTSLAGYSMVDCEIIGNRFDNPELIGGAE